MINFKIDGIIEKLKLPLPGHAATLKFERNGRALFDKKADESTRSSAVMILLYPANDTLNISLIVRPKYDGKHGGQISLPGGKRELKDENLAQTALRETQEEIGVKALDIKVLSPLSSVYIPFSNFNVQPYVGFIDYQPDFYPDPREVEKIIHTSLEELCDVKNRGKRVILVDANDMEVSGYAIAGEWVWGATALILSEFIEILER